MRREKMVQKKGDLPMRSAIIILCVLMFVFAFTACFFHATSKEIHPTVTGLEESHKGQSQRPDITLVDAESYVRRDLG
jgi:hypothetical protein